MIHCREYGNPPYNIIAVHGGPGAPGSCAGICRGLADDFGVLEYLQSKNTIKDLMDELLDIISAYQRKRVVLIGHSWGAWLSFIFASTHPQYVSKLILVGSGLFDAAYYPQLMEARNIKIMPDEQKEDGIRANLYRPNMEYNPDHYCLLPDIPEDMIAFHESQFHSLMGEMMPMRESGELLNRADKIECPVIAIHGKNDPHAVEGVQVPLENRLSDFRMYVLEKCGHDPWKEYYAKDRFFEILRENFMG